MLQAVNDPLLVESQVLFWEPKETLSVWQVEILQVKTDDTNSYNFDSKRVTVNLAVSLAATAFLREVYCKCE
jgi:hypothetical protein